jgi:PAS domain-containing protein
VGPQPPHPRVAFALLGVFGEESGRILRASRALADMLATTPAELTGMAFCELVDPRDRARAVHELSRIVNGAVRSSEGEGRLRCADDRITRVRAEAGLLPTTGEGGGTIVVRLVEIATTD